MNKILYGLIILAAMAVLLGSAGCRTPQQLSSKYFYKALDKDDITVYGECSKIAPPVVMTKDSFIYKQGKTIYKKGEVRYVTVDCDSVVKSFQKGNSSTVKKYLTVQLPCPPCDSVRVDTQYVSREAVEVDRAKEYALQEQNDKLNTELIKTTDSRNDWRLAAIIGWGVIALSLLWRMFKSKFINWIR